MSKIKIKSKAFGVANLGLRSNYFVADIILEQSLHNKQN